MTASTMSKRAGAGPVAPAESPDPEPSPGLAADRVFDDPGWAPVTEMEAAVSDALAALAQRPETRTWLPAHLTLVFADDATVRNLNKSYRGQDKPTNVLSFVAPPQAIGPAGPPFLGDVVLARETVEAEAADLGVPLLHHVQHLVVHGVLHLMGFDHIEDAQAEHMEALETVILAEIGVADPYAPDMAS